MYIYNSEFRLGSNILTASATVLVLDYLFTLDEEINYIWMQPMGFGSILFLLNRYLPFVDTFLALYSQMSIVSPQQCKSLYMVITWLLASGLCVSELILLLRTFAVWQRNSRIFFGLTAMAVSTWAPGIAITFLEIRSFRFEPVPDGAVGCNLVAASKLIMVTFVLLALSETVVCVLTVIKGVQHLRTSSHSWVKHVYRHGLLFYFYLLIITIINMVVPLVAAEPLYKNYLAIPQRVFHSIFCNRVILLISAQRSIRTYASVELTRQHSVTKNNLTGNIDTAINTDLTRQFDVDAMRSDGGEEGPEDEHEMVTYSQDWTR
jgi:hypothetical protein